MTLNNDQRIPLSDVAIAKITALSRERDEAAARLEMYVSGIADHAGFDLKDYAGNSRIEDGDLVLVSPRPPAKLDQVSGGE